jgi:hypothetical protein
MNFFRRIPLLPTLLTVLVVVASAAPATPIFDAATRGEVIDAFLQRPLAYVVLAPLSDVLDTLTLLSSNQHIAILVGALVLFVAMRAFKRDATIKAHAIAALIFCAGTVALYAAAMLLPRPMAALATNNDNVVRVDFHSHTTESHDGHQSVEQLREWHRAAGFDVAYVTDHATVAGAERGMANNPNPAGEGVTILQGIETTWNGEHVSIPNAQRVYRGILTANLGDVDTTGLHLANFVPGREPIVIWNHPRNLGALPPVAGPGTIGVHAMEIVNGAPKDARNLRANRDRIATMGQGGGVALTAGSDNHGYGRAAPGWTLMMIVGWRGATADALALKIEQVIREGGFRATRVVERRVADSGAGKLKVALSIVTVPWVMFTTLSNDERLWWLIWTWVIWGAAWFVRRRRQQTA